MSIILAEEPDTIVCEQPIQSTTYESIQITATADTTDETPGQLTPRHMPRSAAAACIARSSRHPTPTSEHIIERRCLMSNLSPAAADALGVIRSFVHAVDPEADKTNRMFTISAPVAPSPVAPSPLSPSLSSQSIPILSRVATRASHASHIASTHITKQPPTRRITRDGDIVPLDDHTGLTLREQIRDLAADIWGVGYAKSASVSKLAQDLAILAFTKEWPRDSVGSRAIRAFLLTMGCLGSVAETCPAVQPDESWAENTERSEQCG